ncbi:MAG: MoxR family ATPase [Pseudomonadota bacterium]
MNFRSLQTALAEAGYVADDAVAMALHLAVSLERPLLLEGEAGVGKTAIAEAFAATRGARLIRLQCYEGLDAAQSIYEWNYQRQLLAIRAREGAAADESGAAGEDAIFSEKFLLKRPLLDAISQAEPPVLLIDEVDRADEAFEAFLLEILSDFQISIPELGTITAAARPIVILTSNGVRELSDALRRRCLYAYVPYPSAEKELAILRRRLPGVADRLAEQVVAAVQAFRREELEKKPGVAETLDWAAALMGLEIADLRDDPALVQATLVCLLKTERDQAAWPADATARLIGAAA